MDAYIMKRGPGNSGLKVFAAGRGEEGADPQRDSARAAARKELILRSKTGKESNPYTHQVETDETHHRAAL
jgi:hypothetical protein